MGTRRRSGRDLSLRCPSDWPWLLILACLAFATAAQSQAFDPAIADPRGEGTGVPELRPVSFLSSGARMSGVVYPAIGSGRHPTVLLLHGYPGNDTNLDLAHAIRRSGWNVLLFHYRGAWGSEGAFSFRRGLEDVDAVLQAVREPSFSSEYGIEPDRVAVVGHSFGGFAAVATVVESPTVRCAVSLAGGNLGALAPSLVDPDAARAAAEAFDRAADGRVRTLGGRVLVQEIAESACPFNLVTCASQLVGTPILLVSASRDSVFPPSLHHRAVAEAIRNAKGTLITEVALDSDHYFSGARIALARTVTAWLNQNCLDPAQ